MEDFVIYGASVIHGQWWRLLTYASLHLNLPHLIDNTPFLCILGFMVEPAIGPGSLFLLWIVSAIGGSIAQLSLQRPHHTALGASGVVYGLIGVLLFIYLFKWQSLSLKYPVTRIVPLVVFVILNFLGESCVFARPIPGHIGGLLAGILFACLMPLVGPKSQPRILAALSLIILCFGVATSFAIHKQKIWVELDDIDPFRQNYADWGSIPRLEQIVREHPEILRAHTLLAEAYRSGKRYPAAVSEFQYILTKQPSSRDAWSRMGTAYMESPQYSGAVEAFARVLELDSQFAARQPSEQNIFTVGMVHYALAKAYENAGKFDQAIAQYRLALQADPDDLMAEQEIERLENLPARTLK